MTATLPDSAARAASNPPRMRGLDGLRALAVGGVVLYHLGAPWLRGGFLGVDLFFVLSGFLITTLLLEEKQRSGRVDRVAFWMRRARRLLPALFLLLVVVMAYVLIAGRGGNQTVGALDLSQLRGDGIATLLYVANWHLILTSQSYFAQFSTPSPLIHTWSLAIEEQFYIFWPLIAVALISAGRARWRRTGASVALIGAAASALAMALLFHPGSDPSRVYYGTDTRAFDLLIGAAVAFLTLHWTPSAAAGRRLRLAGPAALVVLGVFWVLAGDRLEMPRSFMYYGGFLFCACLAAAAIASAVFQPDGLLPRLLSVRVLVTIGAVSYGIYLWHWPVIVFMNPASVHLHGLVLDAARLALIAALTFLSYVLVEQPIRHHRLSRSVKRWLYPIGTVITIVMVFVGTSPALVAPAVTSTKNLHVAARLPGVGRIGGQRAIALPSTPSATSPLRVGLFGDSMVYVSSPGLQAALDGSGVMTTADDSFPGWGTSTLSSWRSQLTSFIRQNKVQLLIGTWAWDNGLALAHPAEYRQTLTELVGVARAAGASGVILLGYPVSGPPDSGVSSAQQARTLAGERAWAAAAAALPAALPGQAMYFPINPAVELDGRFSSWLPASGKRSAPLTSWVRVRRLDGTHLCAPGIVLYSTALTRDLALVFHVPLPPASWSTGSWTDAPVLSSAAAECPADHPSTRP